MSRKIIGVTVGTPIRPKVVTDKVESNLAQLSNPNLLINGDFQVWQRGTSFVFDVKKYTADMWYGLFSQGTDVFRNDDGTITITNNSANVGYLLQFFEKAPSLNDYTLSLKVKSIAGYALGRYEGDSENITLIKGINTLTRNVSPLGVCFEIHQGCSLTLEWVKVEQGSIATPFVPRLYGEELALCQRYYVFGTHYINNMAMDSTPTQNYLEANGSFPVEMRTNPTVTVDDRSGNVGRCIRLRVGWESHTNSDARGVRADTKTYHLESHDGGNANALIFDYKADASIYPA